jgi:hypothetical protein
MKESIEVIYHIVLVVIQQKILNILYIISSSYEHFKRSFTAKYCFDSLISFMQNRRNKSLFLFIILFNLVLKIQLLVIISFVFLSLKSNVFLRLLLIAIPFVGVWLVSFSDQQTNIIGLEIDLYQSTLDVLINFFRIDD